MEHCGFPSSLLNLISYIDYVRLLVSVQQKTIESTAQKKKAQEVDHKAPTKKRKKKKKKRRREIEEEKKGPCLLG